MADRAGTVRFADREIEMAHGAGGLASRRLIDGLLVPLLGGPLRESLSDAAEIELGDARPAARRTPPARPPGS